MQDDSNQESKAKSSGSNVLQFPKQQRPGDSVSRRASDDVASIPAATTTAVRPRRQIITLAAIGFVASVLNYVIYDSISRSSYDLLPQNETARRLIRNSIRSIASDETTQTHDFSRDLLFAESLASVKNRKVASVSHIGRGATLEEKLRWGPLEEKYTMYKTDNRRIQSIFLQDPEAQPSYLRDRSKFLDEYGSLLVDSFNSAQLNSVQVNEDKTVESYTLLDKDKRPKAEAQFELDRHKRFLSLNVKYKSI